ncbi:MAG: hypothetical protein GW939_00210 [Candidatus Magasanikbacteria bacterium]|uniref:Uncharacterized protein n=1 Tax=Candidatus Magasanikbacteria bacterium CG10_big_fil_rev_8_21_14_0_10_38_6 TaxID=1974647 RepID=A0A2M6P071_9BACT|nr:hypothetical protein [Candidatus Magasanikbacteria bacterium]NCS72239.1 hypothetical protein [Candidatus Magasanikbacteria bacterium]PIR77078.1 MAG: hypothetical protein COU30_04460 [Candidatus Magasanikbacteria bacterium CG10_big_fil_rev_8_21_14_0_10_38_6]
MIQSFEKKCSAWTRFFRPYMKKYVVPVKIADEQLLETYHQSPGWLVEMVYWKTYFTPDCIVECSDTGGQTSCGVATLFCNTKHFSEQDIANLLE